MSDAQSIKAAVRMAYRDTIAVGTDRPYDPAKSDTRQILNDLADLAAAAGTTKVVSTVAELTTLPSPSEGDRAEVRDDPAGDVANGNGVYAYQSGDWVWISDLIPAAVGAAIGGVDEKATEATTALAGQAFDQKPSIGFFRGRPVLSSKINLQGEAIELVTSDGVFVPGADGRLAKAGQAPVPRYLAGASVGVMALADPSVCYLLVILGQSNAEGVMPASEGAVIASAPLSGYGAYSLMPSTGVRMDTRDSALAKTPPLTPAFTSLTALVEAADANIECYESSASSAANHLIAFVEGNTGRRIRVTSFVAALGGATLLEMMPGSTTYGWFIRGLTDTVAAVRAQGWRPVLLPICWRQGESDQAANTDPAQYAAGLLRLRAGLETDARAILGEPVDVKLIVDAPQLWDEATDNDLVAAQQGAAARDPKILLGPPYYQQPRTTAQPIHMSAAGQNAAGVDLARALYDEVFAGGYTPFMPHDWWFEPGRTAVTLRFPRAPVFDETGDDVDPTDLPNYKGLVFDDRSVTPPTITGHAISGTYLTLTLSGASSGPRPRIANATVPNDDGEPGPATGARSLLRSARGPIANIYGGASIYEWSRPFVLNL